MKTVYKNGIERVIVDARLNEFLQAGWTEEVAVTVTARPTKKEKVEVSMVEAEPTVEVPDAAQQELDISDSKGE